jgi:hypothetical protein
MKIKKCKHDKIECKNSDNKFYCIKCKEKIEIEEWVKRYDLSKDLDFVTQFRFDSKIKDAFY